MARCQGDLEYEQGRYAQAAAFSREAVAEDVGTWPLVVLGRVLFRSAATDGAERCLRPRSSDGWLPSCDGTLRDGASASIAISLFEARRSSGAGSDPGVPRWHSRVPCRCRTRDTAAVPGRREAKDNAGKE